jgi:hypothetical protein
MTFTLKNGNTLRVTTERSFMNKVYFEYTISQKDGYWKEKLNQCISLTMYNSIEDFLSSEYKLKLN